MRKLFFSNSNAIRDLIQASVCTSVEQQYLHRLHCVLLIAEGRSCYEIARWFGKDPRTIERWAHALQDNGAEGLRDHHVGGRPGRLAGNNVQRLTLDLQSPPQACGYAQREWSGKLLTLHLESIYGLKLSVRQCQRLLNRLTRAESRGAG